MINTLLIVSYDGTPFFGWQKQPGLPTVQGELERALSTIFDFKVKVKGAGRTDKGVHALRQFANFLSPKEFDSSTLRKSLNSLLPPEIRVLKVVKNLPIEFDARKQALWREYRYFIYRGEVLPPFLARYCYHLRKELDFPTLKRLCSLFEGTHDFSAFCDGEDPSKSKVRNVFSFDFEIKGNFLIFKVVADGFLRHMVRIMVSTLIDVASGRKSADDLKRALDLGDRSLASPALIPNGLWLWNVGFAFSIRRWEIRDRESI